VLLQLSGPSNSPFLIIGLTQLIPLVAWAMAARRSEMLRWKLFFLGITASSALRILFYVQIGLSISYVLWYALLSSVGSCGQLLLSGWVVVVSVLDLVHHQRRDWLHWTGVATYVASAAAMLVWMIGMRFIGLERLRRSVALPDVASAGEPQDPRRELPGRSSSEPEGKALLVQPQSVLTAGLAIRRGELDGRLLRRDGLVKRPSSA